jgi:hypothetical protein
MSGIGTVITAGDYNALIGYDPTTTLNKFNAVWGTGSGKFGYGQTPLVPLEDPTVALDDRIKLSNWLYLANAVIDAKNHQGISTSVITLPSNATGAPTGTISATTLVQLTTAIKDTYAAHLSAQQQGTFVDTQVQNSSTWRNSIEFTFVVTFANGDAARYFFNCGGQLSLRFGSSPGFQINAIMQKLGESAGTLVISSPNVETIKIAGTEYKGVTKIGGSAPAAVDPRFTTERYGVVSYNQIESTLGYYGLSNSFQEMFKQSVGSVPSTALRYNYYDGSYISVTAKTNGPQGTHGDNGNVLTIKVLWDQVPNGLQVAAGTTTTLTVRPPIDDLPDKPWNNPVVSGTVSGD